MKLLSKTILFAGIGLSTISAQAELNTYVIDSSHTAVEWHINHFGFSSPSGKFMNIEGVVKFDPKEINESSVQVTIPIKDVNTGVPKLDEHLLGKAFFDAAKYPTAKFVTTNISNVDEHKFDLEGNLTLHGVTKPVVLHATFNKVGLNFAKAETVGFSANTTINRTEFKMDKYSPGLGNEIKINIQLEANAK
jgi:polyisoprenoid-binding protein YceI